MPTNSPKPAPKPAARPAAVPARGPQRAASGLMAKYGQDFVKAAEVHKADEVEFSGFGDLPPGIEGGIAQLQDCKFDIFKNGDNKGEYYFFAQAVVVSPEYATQYDLDGNPTGQVKVAGKYTKIGPEPVCDTLKSLGQRKTQADHLGWIQNEMKKLLGKDADPEMVSGLNIEATAAALQEAQPHLSFRTWRGKPSEDFPNPRVNHVWEGVTSAPVANGRPAGGTVRDRSAGQAAAPSDNGAAAGADTDTVGEDLDDLAARAMASDKDAVARLTELALDAGYSDDEIGDADKWADVVDMINSPRPEAQEGQDSGEPEAPAEDAEPAPPEPPVKGSTWYYRLKDAKGNPLKDKAKRPLRPVEVEVTAVDKKTSTCTLKNMSDHKTVYKSIPWDELESAD